MLEYNQQEQENLYQFPYHHLNTWDHGNFGQSKKDRWGYEYMSVLRFVIKQLQEINFESLLDVGCGDGKLLYELNKNMPDKNIAGLDYSEKAILLARAWIEKAELIVGDICDKNLIDKKFDAMILIETLEHIPTAQVNDFLTGMHYYLADGGHLVLTVPSVNVPVRPKHYQHFDLDLLQKLLSPLFDIKKHYFLNQLNLGVKILERLLDNRLFLLNEQHLINWLYRYYENHYLLGQKHNTKRICIVCQKK